ncbi:MAG: signal recognition particle protein Srp19 [Thermoplasmatales archaeon]|nr:signal recognition particle protein Srp19 [Thermoplasmatales archaeon]
MKDKWVIWPSYFDIEFSRKEGRKVKKSLAIKNPTIDEIFQAAKKIGLNPLKEEKSYPKKWWRKEGRIVVDKKGKKVEIIRRIAEEVYNKRLQSK